MLISPLKTLSPLGGFSASRVIIRLISSGDIVYRRRRQGGVLYIDYSDDAGVTWELDIAQFLLSENVIEVTIDDSPTGYRDIVRDGAYKIDQLLVGGTGDWDTEGTDWENIISINMYWDAINHLFALPSTGVSLVVGTEITIYGDSLVNVPIENNLSITYTCDIGTVSGNNITFNPVAEDVGNHTLIIKFRNNGLISSYQTITLTVYDLVLIGTKKILMVGDSILADGAGYYHTQLDSVLSNCTLSFLGTLGTTTKHEGYSGYGWYTFVNDVDGSPSPFIKAGVLDIAAYFTDNSIDVPDYIYVMLGTNDMLSACLADGDGLTAGLRSAVLAAVKTFVDGFLAYNASLKIIIGIQTICDNNGIGWDIDYDPAVRIQDEHIKNVHIVWDDIITIYANGTYNSRVDCSYEAINLNRANYTTSGIHPDVNGLNQIGIGMSLKLNESIEGDLIPKDLIIAWENDYMTVDFTDSTAGVAEHEIWESKNGGDYSLVTTLTAATVHYHNSTWQNASMDIKIRAKIGLWYSDYSSVSNYTTPLVFKTDQSISTDVIINQLVVGAGKSVNINWGDSTNNDYTGTNLNITKQYSSVQNPYYITITGDTNYIIDFYHYAQVKSYGDISKWILPTNLSVLNIPGNTYTGDLSVWVIPSGITLFDISGAGSIKYTGNLNSWIIPESAITCIIRYHSFTGLPRGNFKNMSTTGLTAGPNTCSISEIDAFLAYLDTYFITNTPVKNSRFLINSTGMGIPSAAGLISRQGVIDKYIAAGFTATITVNS